MDDLTRRPRGRSACAVSSPAVRRTRATAHFLCTCAAAACGSIPLQSDQRGYAHMLLAALVYVSCSSRTCSLRTRPAFEAMPRKCTGTGGAACTFGQAEGAVRVSGLYRRCVWCDPERMTAACRDSKAGRHNIVKTMKRMTEAQQARAIERVPASFRATFQSLLDNIARCSGRPDEPCIFQETGTGQAAYVKRGQEQCDWCNLELLEAACGTAAGRRKLLPRLKSMSDTARKKAIDQWIPVVHREYFREHVPAGKAKTRPRKRPAVARACKTWKIALVQRKSWRAPASEEQQRAYRQHKLDDRARVRRCFGLRSCRSRRGAQVDNDTGLPPPKRSKLAADLYKWCRKDSWRLCDSCLGLDVAPMTQGVLNTQEEKATIQKCSRCKAAVRCAVPVPEDTPEELRGLDETSIAALAPLACDCGPVRGARTQRRRPAERVSPAFQSHPLLLERRHREGAHCRSGRSRTETEGQGGAEILAQEGGLFLRQI